MTYSIVTDRPAPRSARFPVATAGSSRSRPEISPVKEAFRMQARAPEAAVKRGSRKCTPENAVAALVEESLPAGCAAGRTARIRRWAKPRGGRQPSFSAPVARPFSPLLPPADGRFCVASRDAASRGAVRNRTPLDPARILPKVQQNRDRDGRNGQAGDDPGNRAVHESKHEPPTSGHGCQKAAAQRPPAGDAARSRLRGRRRQKTPPAKRGDDRRRSGFPVRSRFLQEGERKASALHAPGRRFFRLFAGGRVFPPAGRGRPFHRGASRTLGRRNALPGSPLAESQHPNLPCQRIDPPGEFLAPGTRLQGKYQRRDGQRRHRQYRHRN